MTVWWPSISTSWANPARRRALTFTAPSAPVPALEQGGVVDVCVAGHRVDEVGGAVDEADHCLAGQLPFVGEGGDPPLGATDDRAGDVELRREPVAARDHELWR